MRILAVALLLWLPTAGGAGQAGAARPSAEAAAPQPDAVSSAPKPAAKPAAKEPPAKQPPAKAPPPPPAKGSQVKPDDNFCFVCHTNKDQWDEKDPKSWRLYVPPEKFKEDLHFQKGVNCHDCHGGNFDTDKVNVAHAIEDGFRAKPEEIGKYCALCHADQASTLTKSAHRSAGDKDERGAPGPLACEKCHGQSPRPGLPPVVSHELLPAKDRRSPISPENLFLTCGVCHESKKKGMLMGVHAKAGPKDDRGRGTVLACAKCHGDNAHAMLPARDPKSPVFIDNQVEVCGGCHAEYFETYERSVHGHGLYQSGLAVTAACADCHGAHGIFDAGDDRSRLHPTRVAKTCGKCHRFIEEKLQASVHGRGAGAGGLAEREAPGGNGNRKPSCTDCHQKHDQPNPSSIAFRSQLPYRCGNCHGNLSSTYLMSIHGELTELGYGAAAECADCHGAHDILAVNDPQSHLSPANRVETCRQCHPHASANFARFDPHADYTDAERNPLIHGVYVAFMTLLISVFGFFGLHSLLWFVRSLIQVLVHGRPRGLVAGSTAYVRFVPFHRWSHAALLVSFLALAMTGLPLKYHDAGWARQLARALGGFDSTSFWHRFFAVTTFACFIIYVFRLGQQVFAGRKQGTSLVRLIFGPDSPVPNLRDLKDFFKLVRWFVGLGPKPTFERWTYWEKFDFWGACGDVIIIGFTGLILWFPNFFCSFLPGVTLNIAKVIHSTQALLATGFVFAIHFFNTHLRAEKFPADMSVLTGLVSEQEMAEERNDYLERMRRQGELERQLATVPSRGYLWAVKILGFVALGVGLALLAGMTLASLGH